MSDQSQHLNGAVPDEAPQPDLREIAERAYDSVIEQSDDAPEPEQPSERPRDERGRWVSKSPEGEAAAETPPSPPEVTQETEEPHPAPATGQAAQPPSNWSAEDRAAFEKLPVEGQQFLLRRHSEMEGDYQKRVQAAALSNQFVQAIAPGFNDPLIASTMQQMGLDHAGTINQLMTFMRRSIDPNPHNRIDLLFELADRMQLDPAVVFGQQQQRQAMAFTQEELANPAYRKFADHIGMLTSKLQANEMVLQQFQQLQEQARFDASRAQVDAFADTKKPDGTLAYPHFNAIIGHMMEIFRADPRKSMHDCYMEADVPYKAQIQAEVNAALAERDKQQNLARAQNAVRGNVRGNTVPVSRPAPHDGPRSIRDVLDSAADEVGFVG